MTKYKNVSEFKVPDIHLTECDSGEQVYIPSLSSDNLVWQTAFIASNDHHQYLLSRCVVYPYDVRGFNAARDHVRAWLGYGEPYFCEWNHVDDSVEEYFRPYDHDEAHASMHSFSSLPDACPVCNRVPRI